MHTIAMDPISLDVGMSSAPAALTAVIKLAKHIHHIRTQRKRGFLEFAECAAELPEPVEMSCLSCFGLRDHKFTVLGW